MTFGRSAAVVVRVAQGICVCGALGLGCSGDRVEAEVFEQRGAALSGGLVSDDFSPETVLGSQWRFLDVVGDSSVSSSGTHAVLHVAGGASHDMWTGVGNIAAPRLLQPLDVTDFGIETRFESTPSEAYQLQGLVVQASDTDVVRCGMYSTGTALNLFAAHVTPGSVDVYANTSLPAGAPHYLRLERAGDDWVYRYSADGASWTVVASFTLAFAATEAGVYGGNAGGNAPAFDAVVDYFNDLAAPIVDTDGVVLPNAPPQVTSTPPSTVSEEAQYTYQVEATDAEGDPLSFLLDTGPAWLGVDDHGDGTATLSGTAPLGSAGSHPVVLSVSDGEDTTAQSFSIVVTTGGSHPGAGIVSDDFAPETVLGLPWRFLDPIGDSGLQLTGSHALLQVAGGASHDLWAGSGNIGALRLLQPLVDTDFGVETRFESAPSQQFQIQGLVVQATDTDLIRTGVFHTGSSLQVFAAHVTPGGADVFANFAPAGGTAPQYLRLERTADHWTYSYSFDRATWQVAAEFDLNLVATEIGVYGGNAGGFAPAFEAKVDYFSNLSDPVVDTDGEVEPPPANSPPAITSTPLTVAVEGEAYQYTATASDADLDAMAFSLVAAPAWLALTDNGDGTASLAGSAPVGSAGAYDVELAVSDGEDTDEQQFTLVVLAEPPEPAGIVSDDFFPETSLQSPWRFFDPVGDSSLLMVGTHALLQVAAGVPHDLWEGVGNNAAPRLLQPLEDEDFAVEARFESLPSEAYQLQGLIAQATDTDVLRAGVFHDGTSLNVFCARVRTQGASVFANTALPSGAAPQYLRLERSGNQWTYSHSQNGSSWVVGASFSLALPVTEVGVYAGNAGGNAPAFVGIVDYFNDLASPLVDVDELSDDIDDPPVFFPVSPGIASVDEPYALVLGAADPEGAGVQLAIDDGPAWLALTDHGDGSATLAGTPTAVGTFPVEIAAFDGSLTTVLSLDIQVVDPAAPPTDFASDDFFPETTLGAPWRFLDPVGDSTVTLTGTHAVISAPGGTAHDLWTGVGNAAAPRLLQPVGDTSFGIEARFESVPSQAYQIQGLVVQATDTNLIRAGVYFDGSTANVFAAHITTGNANVFASVPVSPGGFPQYLRLERTGNHWVYSYSLDGATWSVAASFDLALTPTEVGVYAGNAGGNAPAYQGRIDYFSNLADPAGDTDAPADEPPPVEGWGCDPSSYGGDDGCDCGCGVVDPDCADATSASCDRCDDIGSCALDATTCLDVAADDNAACGADEVLVFDGFDEGQESFVVMTAAATYHFHKRGGGISSLIDVDGIDWVDYHPTGGFSGHFRGIPNMGDCCHPGYPDNASGKVEMATTIEVDTPTHVRLRTVSDDEVWDVTWDFYDTHVTATVESVGAPYYFGYEGPPGGTLDTNEDYAVFADGTLWDLAVESPGDLPGDGGAPEWVGFVDPGLGRSLLAVQHEGDDVADRYWDGGDMVVFHFGRLDHGDVRGLVQVPLHFSFSFVEATDYASLLQAATDVTAP